MYRLAEERLVVKKYHGSPSRNPEMPYSDPEVARQKRKERYYAMKAAGKIDKAASVRRSIKWNKAHKERRNAYKRVSWSRHKDRINAERRAKKSPEQRKIDELRRKQRMEADPELKRR